MEYCSGGSISDIMHATDAPLDEDLIAYICSETLQGLAYLHDMGKVGHTAGRVGLVGSGAG